MPFDYDDDAPSMDASIQAGALESIEADASIQELHRRLSASGAAAAQPRSSQHALEGLLQGGEDYGDVEPDDMEEFG